MIISKYVHRYNYDGYVAYYHSLRMTPVYLTETQAQVFENAMKSEQKPELDDDILNSLKEFLIVVESDDGVLERIQNHVPKPYVCLVYFVLSEQCNLACKYCFLGNSDLNAQKVTKYPMSAETADKALWFFAKQTQQCVEQFNDQKEIIFYGGEPLINFETLKYVVERSKYYQNKKLLTKNLRFSMITNGLLLNKKNIEYLIENKVNVAISIDGADEEKNQNRVDRSGKKIFKQIKDKLYLAKTMGLRFGLSITLSEKTIKDINSLMQMIDELRVDSVCFNILIKAKNFGIEKSYYIDATNFIIDFYQKTKVYGIYEERFMRKLKAFAESGIYFSDCAATSGSQIVITPDGQIGICHGTMENREHFIGNINDENLIVQNNEEVIHWSRLSPVFKNECVDCPALGICGGGCPVNAQKMCKQQSIDAVDKAFCVHAKLILEFLIKELLRLAIEENGGKNIGGPLYNEVEQLIKK